MDNNKLEKTAGKIAKWLTYTSLSLLFLLLAYHPTFFPFTILGGIFTYLAGLFWDKILHPRNANDGQPSIKITQTIRITLTISIMSLIGIFNDSSGRAFDNKGPVEEEVPIEKIILDTESKDSLNIDLKQ